MSGLGNANLGGAPYNGYMPKQTVTSSKDSDAALSRRLVVRGWDTNAAAGVINGRRRITTPFRAVNSAGDFLSRKDYVCGGPNPTSASRPGYKRLIGSIWSQCDNTGVQSGSCNVKFVADSSDYTRYRGLRAKNHVYNDLGFGGNMHHAEQSALNHVRS